jgi:hypothetical protein
MTLSLLATAYCRSGRVILAEGLLRQACRKLHISLGSAWQAPHGCHASCAAHVSWLYAQLLTALPKRDTEAGQWADVARALWRSAHHGQGYDNGTESGIESAFGDLDALTGKGQRGKVHVLVLLLGRVYPGSATAV